jgi:hypothetical protein
MPLSKDLIAKAAKRNLDTIPKDGLALLEGFHRSYGVLFDHVRARLSRSDFTVKLSVDGGLAAFEIDEANRDVLCMVDTTNLVGTKAIALPPGFDGQRVIVKDVGGFANVQNIDVDGVHTLSASLECAEFVYHASAWVHLR